MRKVRITSGVLVIAMILGAAPLRSIADEVLDNEPHKIHILIMGAGNELFARFGHIAIMVDDGGDRPMKVYNFGTFNFNDPDLRFKYARGFLNYWVSVSSYEDMVYAYRSYGRSLTVRTLNLTPDQAAEIARRLEINARPENREYAYRHYLDNCCTRIRDLLDDVLDGAIKKGRDEKPTGRTFRYWTARALRGLPLVGSAILFSLGPAIDKPLTRWQEEFLPEVLGEDLDTTRLGSKGEPLVMSKTKVLEHKGPEVGSKTDPLDTTIILGIFGTLLLSFGLPLVLGARRTSARLTGLGLLIWGLIAGLGGLLLVIFWGFTTHYDTHCNENLLIMPITHLALLYPAALLLFKASLSEKQGRFLGRYLLVSLGLIALDVVSKIGPFIQDNWGVILLATICNIAALLSLVRSGVLPKLRS